MTTDDVLNSPALSLLLRLEADGFEVVAVEDRLLVKPVSRIAADVRAQLATYRAELLTILRICDVSVQDRREAFSRQLAAGASIGQLAMCEGLPYVAGQCFSCGDSLPRPVFGRCWRCALAWRCAAGASIPPMIADVYDQQRTVA